MKLKGILTENSTQRTGNSCWWIEHQPWLLSIADCLMFGTSIGLAPVPPPPLPCWVNAMNDLIWQYVWEVTVGRCWGVVLGRLQAELAANHTKTHCILTLAWDTYTLLCGFISWDRLVLYEPIMRDEVFPYLSTLYLFPRVAISKSPGMKCKLLKWASHC